MNSKIIVVSTRPPTTPLSGGMAPAVRDACRSFDEVCWYAVGNRDSLQHTFASSIDPSQKEIEIKSSKVEDMLVKQIMVNGMVWDKHYNESSNRIMWPVCHDRYDFAAKDVDPMDAYGNGRVNDLLAMAIADELKDDPLTPIWIHDYHHFMLPRFLDEHGVKNPIVFFNHTPLPDPKLLALPENEELRGHFKGNIKGLAYCDVVNLQTEETAHRFMTYMGIKNPPALGIYKRVEIEVPVHNGTRKMQVGHFPISINTQACIRESKEPVESTVAKNLAAEMTAPHIFLNFERCDYSKGILPRLLAFERLMENHEHFRGQAQIVIGAEPTRKDISEYVQYAKDVKIVADRINSRPDWQADGKPAVILLEKSVPHADVLRLMRNDKPGQRKIGTVTPSVDGMNLVSKEFIAAQDPENAGVLILSSGAGSAAELTIDHDKGAVVYDSKSRELNKEGQWETPETPDHLVTPIVEAMLTAINMPQQEANRRCQEQQHVVSTNNLKLWAYKHCLVMEELTKALSLPGVDAAPQLTIS